MAKILVNGGAGYIGSHTIIELIEQGYEVVSIDNYVNSEPENYDRIKKITGNEIRHYDIDLCDFEKVLKVFKHEEGFDGIIHFAALKSVPESVKKPLQYFENNNQSLINTAKAIVNSGKGNLIFSSSCSVYGNLRPDQLPVSESTPTQMVESPYGYTKLMGENMLRFNALNKSFKTIALRYFNPVGAHSSGLLGELPSQGINNLIPVVTQTAAGIREELTVFGNDYNTRDGSCIRDYIHVSDIANAHVLALEYLLENRQKEYFDVYNLGSGDGVTVLEVLQTFARVNGILPSYKIGPRRAGDVEMVYSDSGKAFKNLGWKTKYDLDEMMRSAWSWQKRLLS
ncbi:MAG TPA: UDP-glucose 4-epimerase GalE [Flavobacteriales bacterium]|jgi:UDP-glucose 4-epimerase|nr:UDP-glucose 4-epimerase GalE [Flavobacteriales bacterium]